MYAISVGKLVNRNCRNDYRLYFHGCADRFGFYYTYGIGDFLGLLSGFIMGLGEFLDRRKFGKGEWTAQFNGELNSGQNEQITNLLQSRSPAY